MTLNAGGAFPAEARLDAKARAQAFNAVLSGVAFAITGARAAAAAATRANLTEFMVVFLDGQKYQHPTPNLINPQCSDKREILCDAEVSLMQRGTRSISIASIPADPRVCGPRGGAAARSFRWWSIPHRIISPGRRRGS